MKTKIFEKIGDIITTFFDNRTKEELFFAEKFNKFFLLEDYLFCVKMIDEGFKPTVSEKTKLEKMVVSKLINQHYSYNDIKMLKSIDNNTRMEGLLSNVPILADQSISLSDNHDYENYGENIVYNSINTDLLTQKQKLSQEDFLLLEIKDNKLMVINTTKEFIEQYKKYYKSGLDSFGDYCKINYYDAQKQKIKLEKLIYLNIIMIKNKLYVADEINIIQLAFQSLDNYMEKNTAKEYKCHSYSKSGKAALNSFVNTLIKYSQITEIDDKDELIRKLNSYSNRTKSLKEEIKKLIDKEDYNLSDLPIQAKEKVENIENLVEKINTEETKTFIEQRLPIILKKYISIHPEYRTSLKNVEGYNATELMIQSLDNIEKMLIAKQQDDNYDLLSELSVENRKIKMHKVV